MMSILLESVSLSWIRQERTGLDEAVVKVGMLVCKGGVKCDEAFW